MSIFPLLLSIKYNINMLYPQLSSSVCEFVLISPTRYNIHFFPLFLGKINICALLKSILHYIHVFLFLIPHYCVCARVNPSTRYNIHVDFPFTPLVSMFTFVVLL